MFKCDCTVMVRLSIPDKADASPSHRHGIQHCLSHPHLSDRLCIRISGCIKFWG